jgi:FlaA1/EpsC-like NDP-sugar epimerase
MSQAVDLVLKSTKMAQGGEVFIFKMPVVMISDLAAVLIEELAPRYGRRPEEICIKIIGTKPGEKMYEELMTEDEVSRSLEGDDMMEESPNLDKSKYNATSIKSKDFISRDAKPINKEEIKAILLNDGII